MAKSSQSPTDILEARLERLIARELLEEDFFAGAWLALSAMQLKWELLESEAGKN